MFYPRFKIILRSLLCLLLIAAACFGQTANQNAKPLILNNPIEGVITEGGGQTYALHLDSRQFAVLVLEQRGVDAALAIEEGGKELLSMDANSNNFGAERVFVQSEDAPRDLIVRVSATGKASGKFSLALAELRKTDDADNLRIAAQRALLEALKAIAEQKSGANEAGLKFAESALKPARESGDQALEADVLATLQRITTELGDAKKAVEYGESALALFTRQNNLSGQATVKYYSGYALVTAGEMARGFASFSEALDLQRKIGDRKAEAYTLLNAAAAYTRTGNDAKALEYSTEAYRAAKETGVTDAQIQALITFALNYYNQSEFAKAIETLNTALPLAQETKSSLIVNIYSELARNTDSLSQKQKALEYFQQTLTLARQMGFNKYNEAIAVNNVAGIYRDLGQFDRSIEYQDQAAKLFDEVGSKAAIIGSFSTRGLTYYTAKDFAKAEQVFTQALKYAEENNLRTEVGTISNNLAQTEMQLNKPEKAVEYFRQSIEVRSELKQRRLEGVSRAAAADAYATLGQNDLAAENATKALALVRAVGDRVTESDALYYLARASRGKGELPAALDQIKDSIKIVESLRSELINQASRAAYFARVRKKYDLYTRLLIELQSQPGNEGYGALAYAASETSRARGLFDLLTEANVNFSGGLSPELKLREQGITAKISVLQTQLLRLRSAATPDQAAITALLAKIQTADNEREQLESEIKRSNPRYAALKYPTTIDLAQTQSLLDEKTVLLEYQTSPEISYLFAVTKNDFQIVPLPTGEKLRTSIEALRRAITTPARTGLATYLVNGRELYRTLLAPVENLLKIKSKIIVAADGAISYLPFEVLLRNDKTAGLDKLPYLVRDFEISYTPSASVLASLKNTGTATPKPAKSFLAFAAPDYELRNTAPLPAAANTRSGLIGERGALKLTNLKNAKTEADRIAALFPAGQAAVYTGAAATEEKAKSNELLSQYRYLHFAVHGLIDERQPQFSSLVLALPKAAGQAVTENASFTVSPANQPAKVEDGLLQTPEIFELRLRADLVTLSACETGLGQELRGEGLVGLTRAFFYAGTPSILVSLWKVDDASTAELMTEFYAQLRKPGDRSKSAALQAAQLKLIAGNRYAHPYYWAPFILQGKTESNP